MKIDTAGNYTLRYTAEDECGNETVIDRSLVVEGSRTVLYTDGTFIINEKPSDRAANEALHGVATNEYDPFDQNGDTNVKKYAFSSPGERLWNLQAQDITSVQIGTPIHPTSTMYWFSGLTSCATFDLENLFTNSVTNMMSMFESCSSAASINVSNFDTRLVTDMSYMFSKCSALQTLDISGFDTTNTTNMASMFDGCELISTITFGNMFDTSSVTNMSYMFRNCKALTSANINMFDTSSVTDMSYMFYGCEAIVSLDVSNFVTNLVATMRSMFYQCLSIKTLDLSSFNTIRVTTMEQMFRYCSSMETIYASTNFIVTQVISDANMFGNMSTNLVGGSGTVWVSSRKSKTYARIDNPPDEPGYFTLKTA